MAKRGAYLSLSSACRYCGGAVSAEVLWEHEKQCAQNQVSSVTRVPFALLFLVLVAFLLHGVYSEVQG